MRQFDDYKGQLSAWTGAWAIILLFLLSIFLIFGQGCATVGKNSNSPQTYGAKNYEKLKGKNLFTEVLFPFDSLSDTLIERKQK